MTNLTNNQIETSGYFLAVVLDAQLSTFWYSDMCRAEAIRFKSQMEDQGASTILYRADSDTDDATRNWAEYDALAKWNAEHGLFYVLPHEVRQSVRDMIASNLGEWRTRVMDYQWNNR